MIVTEELSSSAEFISLNLIAEGSSALCTIPEIPKEGAHVPFANQENRSEKKAKASAATSQ